MENENINIMAEMPQETKQEEPVIMAEIEKVETELLKQEEKPQEEKLKEVLRFNPELENKITTKLNKIFSLFGNVSEEDVLKLEKVFVMDPANICGIQGKTEQAKRLLSKYIEASTKNEIKRYEKMPTLNYTVEKEEISSKFSMEYINKIFGFFSVFKDESLNMQLRKDFPLSLETEHFKFILAPKIDND